LRFDGVHNNEALEILQEIEQIQSPYRTLFQDIKIRDAAVPPAEIGDQTDSHSVIREIGIPHPKQ
jgi:hypothetical protein